MMKRLFVLLVGVLSLINIFCQERRKTKEEEIYELSKNYDKPILFYGKVIDQDGEAVKGISVKGSYNYFEPSVGVLNMYIGVKRIVTVTDEEGRFEIKGVGYDLSVWVEEKDGYDVKGISSKGYEYNKEGKYRNIRSKDTSFKSPDPSNPEIFQIRKKGEPTMLFSTTDKISFVKSENRAYALCFATYGYWYTKVLLEKVASSGKRIDLIVSGKYQDAAYILNFKAVGDSSAGIILSDERLYSAPAEGYRPEIETLLKEGATSVQKTLYLYVKSGTPPIFSRVELNVIVYPQGDQLFIEYHSYTNPYGERNLEGGWHMYALKEYKNLEEEAKKMLKDGKYPPRQDFKALEEKAAREYLKTHKENQ